MGRPMRTAGEVEVRELMEWSAGPRISAFVAPHPPGTEPTGDGLRLKELLHRARQELADLGMRRSDAADLISGVSPVDLVDRTTEAFHAGGFAVYVAPGVQRLYRVPEGTPELMTTGDCFHVKPLLGALRSTTGFYVLTLTRGAARLFRSGEETMTPTTVPGLPDGLDAAVLFDDRERMLTSHSSARAGRGDVVAGFHGQGDRSDHLGEDVLRYLRLVHHALATKIGPAPIVLAGNPALLSSIRRLADSLRFVPGSIEGNPDRLGPAELHSKATALLAQADDAKDTDLSRFEQLHGTGRASADLGRVVAGALSGRVDTIFVARDQQVWGRALDGGAEPIVHSDRRAGDVDLLDRAAAAAWSAGATIHVLPSHAMPGETTVGAIFRY